MPDSPDDPKPEHKRRPRYRGTHPRAFSEKYKELAAERYPDLIAHVIAKGRTPAGQHVPIMVEEVIEALNPQPGERGVDATLGWGGHARRLLERLSPGGTLLGLDADPVELPKTTERLRRLGFGEAALATKRTNFAAIHGAIAEAGWHDGVDVVFADLGVSSMQIDDPSRGFSFAVDGPLDMRMNTSRGNPAAEWLARATLETITTALRDNADEPHAAPIAEALTARRGEITTTAILAGAVRAALAERIREDAAELSVRRVFQALRIEVNDEFGALDMLLRQLPECLRPGGRVVFLTFHSGEDRRVKKAFDHGEREGIYTGVPRRVIRASFEEQRANPRSTAAKMRFAHRTDSIRRRIATP